MTNLDRFKKDLEKLVGTGSQLEFGMKYACFPDEMKGIFKTAFQKEAADDKTAEKQTAEFIAALPSFKEAYQPWYSETLALLRQLLPDRVADFRAHYEKPKGRKAITCESYRIEDYLQGLSVASGIYKEKIVGPDAAIPHVEQQCAILKAAKARFESSLFEIRQLVQADLLDSEISAAEELANHKFIRAAGAVAGVVLEKHLAQVCNDHSLAISKKKPTISDFNNALKEAEVIDVSQWRFIQHLGDIRNLCDHGRSPDPSLEQAVDLVQGVRKITKTVY